MHAGPDPGLNSLLASWPGLDQAPWRKHLEWVSLPAGQILQEAGQSVSHVIFPSTAIVALVMGLEDGAGAEIALVGREGVVGISAFMGGESMPHRAEVMCAGHGFRLGAQHLQQAFHHCELSRQLLLRYTQALITQMAQTVVCNRHHQLEQRLCRLLLLSLDRLKSPVLPITHESIAQMLCARREGVTEAAISLRAHGYIHYERGRIEVMDRAGLERCVCECYHVVEREYGRLLQPGSVGEPALGTAQIRPGPTRVPQPRAATHQGRVPARVR